MPAPSVRMMNFMFVLRTKYHPIAAVNPPVPQAVPFDF
jgi:hypothetical protein